MRRSLLGKPRVTGSDDVEQLVAATSALVADLHRVVEALESLHPGRKFTPDGHLVGSLGEVVAVALFDIQLHNASNKGCDAVAADGRTVEIKATYGSRGVGVRRSSHGIADALIVLKLSEDGNFEVVYDGPYALAHTLVRDKPNASNGQVSMRLASLRSLNSGVEDCDRVPRR
jgi:hypothetical protein